MGLGILPLAAFALPAISLSTAPGGAGFTSSAAVWMVGIAIVLVTLINGVFVAADVAIDILRPMHLKAIDAEGSKSRLEELMEGRERYVAAAFIGSQTMRAWMILLGFLLAPWCASLIPALAGRTDIAALFWAAVIVSLPIAAVNLVVGELIPKSYAANRPVNTCLRLYWLVRALAVPFQIPATVAMKIAGLFTRRLGADPTFAVANQAEEEIKTLIDAYEESGDVEEDEAEMLDSVFEFGDTVAREIMTPRVDMVTVSQDDTMEDAARVTLESGFSRIPVIDGTEDRIAGVLHAKDIMRAMMLDQESSVSELMREPTFVPISKPLPQLLQEMQLSRSHLAIVRDEFGGTAGLVTLEDVVEEVFGEIEDEYDEEEELIVPNGRGVIVGGKLNLDDLNDEIDADFESEEFDTIGGYVFGLFGRQPENGEQVEASGHTFTIEETDGRRIQRLRIEPEPGDAETADA